MTQPGSSKGGSWIYLVAAMSLLPLMVSNDSLWIDEGASAQHAMQPNVSAWWHYLLSDMEGDSQQPLGMFLSWIAGRAIGMAEWQLRSINIALGVLTLVFVWNAGKLIGAPALPLVFAIQPFFWSITNDARPYAVEITCGVLLLWAFCQYLADAGKGRLWAALFAAGAICLCYATILAPLLLLMVAATAACVAVWRNWRLDRRALTIFAVAVLAVIPAAIYYIYILRRGVGTAKLWKVDFRYLGYVAYDLGGAGGIGPSLDDLRAIGHNTTVILHDMHLLPQLGGALLLIFLLMACVIFAFRVDTFKPQRNLLLVVAAPFLLEMFAFFAIGLATQKNLWPRHLSAAFPFYVAVIGIAMARLWHTRAAYRALLIVTWLLLLVSCLQLRFAERYRKDDYRTAAQVAKNALGNSKSVWWVAGPQVADYYSVPLAYYTPVPGRAFYPRKKPGKDNPQLTSEQFKEIPLPDLIILSRPEVYDTAGGLREMLSQKNYHLAGTTQSFAFFEK